VSKAEDSSAKEGCSIHLPSNVNRQEESDGDAEVAMVFAKQSRHRFCSVLLFLALALLQADFAAGQSSPPLRKLDETWTGRRIVMLKGFGDYFVSGENGCPQLIRAEGLGANIVAVAERVEGERVWLKANGAGDAPVGWVDTKDVIALEEAIPYFTALIERDSKNWDAYLRRAEAEHAQNQRDAAIADYSAAIGLHPDEPFLYLRRGRSFRTMKACQRAVGDFDEVIRLDPKWAEPYNLKAGVYTDCPDPQYRNPQKAIALVEHAMALDIQHPAYLTVLARAYYRNGNIEGAIITLRQALESPRFPEGYRQEATDQLHEYERALAMQKLQQH
jgi:tetratricopeptide (TPR) repeat protein